MLNPSEVKTVLEAALLAAQEPLPISELRRMFDEEIGADTIRRLLEELREAWKERGVELVATASGWRSRRAPRTRNSSSASIRKRRPVTHAPCSRRSRSSPIASR